MKGSGVRVNDMQQQIDRLEKLITHLVVPEDPDQGTAKTHPDGGIPEVVSRLQGLRDGSTNY